MKILATISFNKSRCKHNWFLIKSKVKNEIYNVSAKENISMNNLKKLVGSKVNLVKNMLQ